MADSATKARAAAISGFAAELAQLRDSVGTPSFRVMAGRSKVISHTTLHEAVQGHRLPSWGTTAQFVQACGADPADYRERWEQANRVVGSAVVTQPAGGVPGAATNGTGERSTPVPGGRVQEPPVAGDLADGDVGADLDVDRAAAATTVPRHRRRWYAVLGATAAGMLLTGGGILWSVAGRDQTVPPAEVAAYTADDCPVQQTNPPAQPPRHEGDKATFVTDVTVPDCTKVRRGQTLVKVWRIKNAGTVPWSGYALRRVDLPQTRDQCQTITEVPIADTPPGKTVDVSVEIVAPSTPAFCFVRFKTVDATGELAFPGSRPVNFQVIVD